MMKKLMVLSLVLAIGAVSGAGITMVETEIGVNQYRIDLVQSEYNATGLGGILTINVGNAEVSELFLLPKPNYAGGNFYGWSWLMDSIYVEGSNVIINAAVGLGTGTPGIGSIVNPLTSQAYEKTASFVLTISEETDVMLSFPGTNAWDGSKVGQTLTLIPEPMTLGLLSLGALFLRRRK